MKVCVIVSYRGAYARLKTTLRAVRARSNLDLKLIAGGSALLERYGAVVNVIEADGFEVAARLHMVLEGENPISMAKSTGIGMMELTTALDSIKPDVVVINGDRYESIGCAVATSCLNIPIVHVQGGEVTGSIDEKVRHGITKFADYHFVANEDAARRVERMGEEPERIFVTGCPSIDLAAASVADETLNVRELTEYRGAGAVLDIEPGSYMIVMYHPVTTEYEDAGDQVQELLDAVYDIGMPTLWFWPNVDAGSDLISKRIRVFRENYNPEFIHFFKNLPPEIFYQVLANSRCLVGSSSVGIRESSFLGVPVVNIGTRQTGRLRGPNVMDVIGDKEGIVEAVRQQVNNGRYPQSDVYGDGYAGERMAGILSDLRPTLKGRITY